MGITETAILEKTLALADAIRSGEAFRRVGEARAAMEKSSAAAQANARYDTCYREVRLALNDGRMTPQEARERLTRAREERNAIPEIAAAEEAQKAYQEVLDQVESLLGMLLKNGSSAQGEGCSGNCSTCSGCA